MFESFETQEYGPTESFEGPDNFAKRCLELGRLSLVLMEHGRHPLNSTYSTKNSVKELAEFTNVIEYPNKQISIAIEKYKSRVNALAKLKAQDHSPEDLYRLFFNKLPDKQLEVTWTQAGLVFWCEDSDYEHMFVYLGEESVEDSVERARRSAGVAFGEMNLEGFNTGIPVAAIKPVKVQIETYHDTATPDSLDLTEISCINLSFNENNERNYINILPVNKEQNYKLRFLKAIDENSLRREEDLLINDNSITKINKGPYEISIEAGKISFNYIGPEDNELNKVGGCSVEIVKKGGFNRNGKLPDFVKAESENDRLHELQHLLNNLFEPARRNSEKSPRKPKSTKEQLVAELAEYALKVILDESIRNEFLASMIGDKYTVNEIVDILVSQTEEIGLSYNYLAKQIRNIAFEVKYHRSEIDTVSEVTYLVMAEVAKKYRGFVNKTATEIDNFLHTHVDLTRDDVIGILAPHPFHTWPTVLRAVNRYLTTDDIPDSQSEKIILKEA